ncbi:hypothetical protein KUH03_11195 [Sphingobacterium sp. E70]|uniref:hypothetical protein n=1 Tax=Sphingobacterium sp. E70 TaxID=2853439 RepID=UPI00211B9DE5|nr:hypothetical protein [Sphingobacterium sp. E70]ULT27263.1 hypothetical protein KUH03_11195 [Sphingobacterium sp. E70]
MILSPLGGLKAQINIAAKQKSLISVFRQVEKQSKYVFLYDKAVENSPAISFDCANCSIERVIQLLEQQTKLEFKISGQQVLVKKRTTKGTGKQKQQR